MAGGVNTSSLQRCFHPPRSAYCGLVGRLCLYEIHQVPQRRVQLTQRLACLATAAKLSLSVVGAGVYQSMLLWMVIKQLWVINNTSARLYSALY